MMLGDDIDNCLRSRVLVKLDVEKKKIEKYKKGEVSENFVYIPVSSLIQ